MIYNTKENKITKKNKIKETILHPHVLFFSAFFEIVFGEFLMAKVARLMILMLMRRKLLFSIRLAW